MADQDDIMYMLGEIKGKLDGVQKSVDAQNITVGKMDKRLHRVEVKAAMNGAFAGTIMGVGVSVLVHSIREALKTQGT